MDRGLLVPDQDMLYRVGLVQLVVYLDYRAPGEPENGVDTLFLETLDKRLGA